MEGDSFPVMSLSTLFVLSCIGLISAAPASHDSTSFRTHHSAIQPRISEQAHNEVDAMTQDILLCLKLCTELAINDCSWNQCEQSVAVTAADVTSRNAARMTSSRIITSIHNSLAHRASGDNDVDNNNRFTRTLVASSAPRRRSSLLNRRKRWTYIDPLRVCIAQKCEGLSEVTYYRCVYKKCVPK